MDLFDKLFQITAETIYEIDMQYEKGKKYWPLHPALIERFVGKVIFKEFLRIFKKLEKMGYTITDIAKIIKNPSIISNFQSFWLEKIDNLSYEEKIELLEIFLKLLIILRNGEPFCENGRNLVWSKKELEEEMEKYEKYFINVDENNIKILSKLEALLPLYAESLYYYRVDFSRMMHGPYYYKNSIVFVKEYHNLRPLEVIKECIEFPFNHFKEIGIYENINIKVSFFGHTYSTPPFHKAIKKFVVIIDGKIINDPKKLKKIYEKAEIVARNVVNSLSKKINDKKFLIERGAKVFLYSLKPLYDEINENWIEILSKIKIPTDSSKLKSPPSWGDWKKEKIISFLLRKMDFRKTTK